MKIELDSKKLLRTRSITSVLKLKVLKRDNYKCRMCSKSPATHEDLDLEIDHIMPFSKGGVNEYENLQTLCSKCNQTKLNSDMVEIMIWLPEKEADLIEKICGENNLVPNNFLRCGLDVAKVILKEKHKGNKLAIINQENHIIEWFNI